MGGGGGCSQETGKDSILEWKPRTKNSPQLGELIPPGVTERKNALRKSHDGKMVRKVASLQLDMNISAKI